PPSPPPPPPSPPSPPSPPPSTPPSSPPPPAPRPRLDDSCSSSSAQFLDRLDRTVEARRTRRLGVTLAESERDLDTHDVEKTSVEQDRDRCLRHMQRAQRQRHLHLQQIADANANVNANVNANADADGADVVEGQKSVDEAYGAWLRDWQLYRDEVLTPRLQLLSRLADLEADLAECTGRLNQLIEYTCRETSAKATAIAAVGRIEKAASLTERELKQMRTIRLEVEGMRDTVPVSLNDIILVFFPRLFRHHFDRIRTENVRIQCRNTEIAVLFQN
ncbi:unnamed protein product, partial [Protopolystoma xenopodis]